MLILSGSIGAAETKLPTDLASVPPNCLGFIHVHGNDLWKSDAFKEFRELILRAGPDALKTFDKRFVPAPSTLDRLTVYVLPPGTNQVRGPMPVFIVSFSKPFEKETLLKQMFPQAEPIEVKQSTYYHDRRTDKAITFIDTSTLSFGDTRAIEAILKDPAPKEGPLSAALELAAKGKAVVGGLNVGLIPAEGFEAIPPDIRAALKMKVMTFALELGKESQLEVALHYANATLAADAERSLKILAKMALGFLEQGRKEAMKLVTGDGKSNSIEEVPMAALGLFALGSLNVYEEFLNNPPIRKEDSRLKITLNIPSNQSAMVSLYAGSVGLLLPAVQKVRQAAARAQSQNNLKQLGLAMHNYHDVNNALPSAAVCDKKGKPLLSWRVTILPYLEQNELYKEFKLDEPWDSEHNKKLIKLMPKTYMLPSAPTKEGETYYRIFYGKDAGFDLIQPLKFSSFTDGLSNTMLVFEADESTPWTKPDDFEYDAEKPLPKMGKYSNGGFNILIGDGSVRWINPTITEKNLRALITRNGGEIVDFD
jgi:hypothetical protein